MNEFIAFYALDNQDLPLVFFSSMKNKTFIQTGNTLYKESEQRTFLMLCVFSLV